MGRRKSGASVVNTLCPGVAARLPRAGDLPHMPSIPLPSSFTPFTPFTPGVRIYPIYPLALDIPHIPFCSGYTPYTPYTPLAPIYPDLPRSQIRWQLSAISSAPTIALSPSRADRAGQSQSQRSHTQLTHKRLVAEREARAGIHLHHASEATSFYLRARPGNTRARTPR